MLFTQEQIDAILRLHRYTDSYEAFERSLKYTLMTPGKIARELCNRVDTGELSKLEAVKILKTTACMGLKEAKDLIDSLL